MDPEDVANLTKEELTELLVGAWETNIKFGDMLETAWGIIAAADWDAPGHPQSWRMAAERWREGYHKNLVLIEDNTTDKPEEEGLLLERMAEEIHIVWSGWLKYMFTKGLWAQGQWTMEEFARQRWVRQMKTSYAQLSESEKDTDRHIAERYLNIALSVKPKDITRSLSSEEVWNLVRKENENV